MKKNKITRREFLKTVSVGLGSLYFHSFRPTSSLINELTQGERLGRILEANAPLKVLPDIDSRDVRILSKDEILPWLGEVVGKRPMWNNQRFVETPEGYVYSANIQPVQNNPNQPLINFPKGDGMWVEVTVPYVDLELANPPARSPWLGYTANPRLYFSQIIWVDQIKQDEQNQIWYRVAERYGSYGDIFWAPGFAFRPITGEEIAPINPEIEDKRVEVNLSYQTLSCFENNQEVYFCRVSSGGKYDENGNPSSKWATPLGSHTIWRKLYSVHMTGGTTGGGYDLPGIGWTVLFSGKGMAIHSTFWHNSFGIPKSHGCVNVCPDDAKWIFRWTMPVVPAETGEITISGKGSTKVIVVD